MAYGVMVYVKSVCIRHYVKVSLQTKKYCVAAVKLTTTSKLRLLACVLLSKLIVSVKEAVVVRGTVAKCLKRILLVRFANFVVVDQTYSKRLDELDRISGSGYSENVAQECLMDVPTDINPSDITTRLLSPNAFFSELCWKGLDFLQFEILVCHVRVF